MIEGLKNMYEAFNQRLDMFFQATGQNDITRGVASDTEKTFGERQLEGKYALNRIEPFQRQVQEWIKNNYQLLMEMALQNFSDRSLDEYITPQTLDREDQQRYIPSLQLLKSNRRKRFRVDFETDSTIYINEQYQKQQAVDFANMASKVMESIAKVSESMPELAPAQLSMFKGIIEQYADGKLYFDEIVGSLEEIIEKTKQPKPPEPDPQMMKVQLDGQKLQADDSFRKMQLQMGTQIELAKLQQKNRQDALTMQLEQLRMGIEQGKSQQELGLAVAKLQADIATAAEELSLKKEEMLAAAQREGGKQALEAFRAQIDARVASQEITLAEAAQQLEAYRVQMEAADTHASLEERIITERRLQDEHSMNKEAHVIETLARMTEASTPEPAKTAPVTIDLSKTVHVKPSEKSKSKAKK
jgi:hypothetical protein